MRTHNSSSYGIKWDSEFAPDLEAPPQVRRLGALAKFFMVNWTRTQNHTLLQQLIGGVRYFDFRVATGRHQKTTSDSTKVLSSVSKETQQRSDQGQVLLNDSASLSLPATDNLFFVHGLYANSIRTDLNEIKMFLQSHPREIVLLDFNHFYDMDSSHAEKFYNLLQQVIIYIFPSHDV
ncbi:unnamed protein product [Protopolystoma xenopodis]|uniref:Phosphatidylinositol-specific phospholipase C X domain-containing protein n=1 Tax=Protopolystoma xenopodis TaxID=117903 RepID=A0A448WUC2_9PLAT|nr:unnamed protein product [Protopolystoma xenopodis]